MSTQNEKGTAQNVLWASAFVRTFKAHVRIFEGVKAHVSSAQRAGWLASLAPLCTSPSSNTVSVERMFACKSARIVSSQMLETNHACTWQRYFFLLLAVCCCAVAVRERADEDLELRPCGCASSHLIVPDFVWTKLKFCVSMSVFEQEGDKCMYHMSRMNVCTRTHVGAQMGISCRELLCVEANSELISLGLCRELLTIVRGDEWWVECCVHWVCRLRPCVCMHVCVYTYTYVCICICMCVYVHMFMYVCMR